MARLVLFNKPFGVLSQFTPMRVTRAWPNILISLAFILPVG